MSLFKRSILFLIVVFSIATIVTANSLWDSSSGSKFKNPYSTRIANGVGDILNVSVYDDTTTSYSYDNPNYKGGLLSLITGLIKSVTNFDLAKLLPTTATTTIANGKTTSNNQSQFVTQIAAVVTAVEPNGNLEIKGSKEMKVGQSMKEVQIQGTVDPDEIQPDDSINSSNIANLKIWYDGSLVFQQGMNPQTWIGWLMNSLASILF